MIFEGDRSSKFKSIDRFGLMLSPFTCVRLPLLHELDSALRLFPELDIAVLACRDHEVRRRHHHVRQLRPVHVRTFVPAECVKRSIDKHKERCDKSEGNAYSCAVGSRAS